MAERNFRDRAALSALITCSRQNPAWAAFCW